MAESEKTLAQRWMDLLGEDGFRPQLEVNDEHPEQMRICFKSKGTKVTVDLEDRVAWFNIEGFGEAPPSTEMFERMVGQCGYSADRFFSTLRKSTTPMPLVS